MRSMIAAHSSDTPLHIVSRSSCMSTCRAMIASSPKLMITSSDCSSTNSLSRSVRHQRKLLHFLYLFPQEISEPFAPFCSQQHSTLQVGAIQSADSQKKGPSQALLITIYPRLHTGQKQPTIENKTLCQQQLTQSRPENKTRVSHRQPFKRSSNMQWWAEATLLL